MTHHLICRSSLFAIRSSLVVWLGLSLGCSGPSEPSEVSEDARTLKVSSISPNYGPAASDTQVVIEGTGFKAGAVVTLRSRVFEMGLPTTAIEVVVQDSTRIVALIPPHPVGPGPVDVSVKNPNSYFAGTLVQGYTYVASETLTPLVFTDRASGFSTADVHDAQEEVVQFTTDSQLIWTADGMRFSGYRLFPDGVIQGPCSCWFDVRFGSRNGTMRAYLTALLPHEGSAGTVVDLVRVGSTLGWQQTNVPIAEAGPGKLFGVVTENTAEGLVALANVYVSFSVAGGWRSETTDQRGYYQIIGLEEAPVRVDFYKAGYDRPIKDVVIKGDTRVDATLTR